VLKFASLLLAGTLLLAAGASAKPIVPQQLLGFVAGSSGVSVVKLDATTLRRVSKLATGAGTSASYVGSSVGGARGAISTAERGGTLRFLDLRRMRWEGSVPVAGGVRASLWNYADRLVVVTGGPTAAVRVIDPITRKIRATYALRGPVTAVSSTSEELVAVIAPLDGIGPSRLAVVDDRGRVRLAPLPQIRSGGDVVETTGPEPFVGLFEQPAVAVDPLGKRAVAIGADGSVADVRLDTLAVTAKTLPSRTLARGNKVAIGHARSARWIDATTIALTGSDGWLENGVQRWAPAGLQLVDVRGWSTRTLDSTTTDTAFTGTTLLAFGGYWVGQGEGVFRAVGDGFAGYTRDGARTFHVFEGRLVMPACISGIYAYFADQNRTQFTIVNTQTGAIVGTAQTRTPTALASLFRF